MKIHKKATSGLWEKDHLALDGGTKKSSSNPKMVKAKHQSRLFWKKKTGQDDIKPRVCAFDMASDSDLVSIDMQSTSIDRIGASETANSGDSTSSTGSQKPILKKEGDLNSKPFKKQVSFDLPRDPKLANVHPLQERALSDLSRISLDLIVENMEHEEEASRRYQEEEFLDETPTDLGEDIETYLNESGNEEESVVSESEESVEVALVDFNEVADGVDPGENAEQNKKAGRSWRSGARRRLRWLPSWKKKNGSKSSQRLSAVPETEQAGEEQDLTNISSYEPIYVGGDDTSSFSSSLISSESSCTSSVEVTPGLNAPIIPSTRESFDRSTVTPVDLPTKKPSDPLTLPEMEASDGSTTLSYGSEEYSDDDDESYNASNGATATDPHNNGKTVRKGGNDDDSVEISFGSSFGAAFSASFGSSFAEGPKQNVVLDSSPSYESYGEQDMDTYEEAYV